MENSQPALGNTLPPRRWPLFLIGFLLFVLGLVLNGVQFGALERIDMMPWYMPVLASAGVLLMAVSAWQRRGVLRISGLVLFGAACGLLWFFLLVFAKTPEYTGPGQVGKRTPAFETTLANGTSFTDHDLAKGNPTILLFYRGHW